MPTLGEFFEPSPEEKPFVPTTFAEYCTRTAAILQRIKNYKKPVARMYELNDQECERQNSILENAEKILTCATDIRKALLTICAPILLTPEEYSRYMNLSEQEYSAADEDPSSTATRVSLDYAAIAELNGKLLKRFSDALRTGIMPSGIEISLPPDLQGLLSTQIQDAEKILHVHSVMN